MQKIHSLILSHNVAFSVTSIFVELSSTLLSVIDFCNSSFPSIVFCLSSRPSTIRFDFCRVNALTGGKPVLSVVGLSLSNTIKVVSISSTLLNMRFTCSAMTCCDMLSTSVLTSLFTTVSTWVSSLSTGFCDKQLTRNRALISHRARGDFFHCFTKFIDISSQ